MLTDGLIFKARGKLFHSRGAAEEKSSVAIGLFIGLRDI